MTSPVRTWLFLSLTTSALACGASDGDTTIDAQVRDASALDARTNVVDAALMLPPFGPDAMTSSCVPLLAAHDASCPAEFCVHSPLSVGASDSFFITGSPLYSYVKPSGQTFALGFAPGRFDAIREADQAVITNVDGETGFRTLDDDSSNKYRGTPAMIERYTFDGGILRARGWAVIVRTSVEVPSPAPRACERDGGVCFTALCDYAEPSGAGYSWVHYDYAGTIMGIE